MSKIGQAVLEQIEEQEITVEQLIEKGLQNEVRV
jgi:hypothetical protein